MSVKLIKKTTINIKEYKTTLRSTTIPKDIIDMFWLEDGDKLVWKVHDNKKITLEIEKGE